jgi:hypothetical protein
MRVMVLVKATQDSEAGVPPSAEALTAMEKFNEELAASGIVETLGGLMPSSHGVRVRVAGGTRTIIDGPFAETKELVAGFMIMNVGSIEEVIEWIRRSPITIDGEVEIRPLYGSEVFDAPT